MNASIKRVLISQRRDNVAGRNETRDGLDVRFANMLWDMGFAPLPIASGVPDPRRYIDALAPDAIVLSGGNDIGTMPARDATETALLDHAAATGIPVFAICRGLQFLNHYQGGTTVPVRGHVATRHSVSGPLAPQGRDVNSYHGLGITPDSLGRDLVVLATGPDGDIEALCHAHLPWLGVMWHPERETKFDPADIRLMQQHLTNTQSELLNPKNGASL